MKKLVITTLISAAFSFGQAYAEDVLELEASINGEVSASGLYATQAEEDQVLAALSEPCIHGEEAVSSSYTVKVKENIERNSSFVKAVEGHQVKAVSAR